MVGDFVGMDHEAPCVDAEVVRFEGTEKFRGSMSVGANAIRATLADLDAGDSKLDQALQQIGERTTSSGGVPEMLPRFVGFPIIAGVEKGGCEVEGWIAGDVVQLRSRKRRTETVT